MEAKMGSAGQLLVPPDVAAARLSIGKSKFYQLLRQGEFRVVRVGRATRIPVSDLEAWAEAHAHRVTE